MRIYQNQIYGLGAYAAMLDHHLRVSQVGYEYCIS